jgi:hypothetical protein
MRGWRRLAGNGALLLGAILIAGLVAELFVRIAIPQQLILKRPDIWRPDSMLGYVHHPDVRTTVNTGERTVSFFTDADGLRVGPLGRRAGQTQILLLGDSFMEALQVEYEQSFAGLVEARLSAVEADTVVVRNAAVGGWDPDQYLIRARGALRSERFALTVVSLYVENDAIDYWRDRVPPRVPVEVHRLRFPKVWSVAGITDAVLYPVNDMLEVRSHLFVLMKNSLQGLRMRLGLTAATFPVVYLRAEAASPRWDNTAEICARVAELGRHSGTPTLFLLIPAPHQVDQGVFAEYVRGFGIDTGAIDLDQPSRLLREALTRRGLQVVDALEPFRQAHNTGRVLYGRVDNHLSPDGHAVLVEAAAPDITRLLRRAGGARPAASRPGSGAR